VTDASLVLLGLAVGIVPAVITSVWAWRTRDRFEDPLDRAAAVASLRNPPFLAYAGTGLVTAVLGVSTGQTWLTLVGALLLACFVLAFVIQGWRVRRAAARDGRELGWPANMDRGPVLFVLGVGGISVLIGIVTASAVAAASGVLLLGAAMVRLTVDRLRKSSG
jgi:hypothetical protein